MAGDARRHGAAVRLAACSRSAASIGRKSRGHVQAPRNQRLHERPDSVHAGARGSARTGHVVTSLRLGSVTAVPGSLIREALSVTASLIESSGRCATNRLGQLRVNAALGRALAVNTVASRPRSRKVGSHAFFANCFTRNTRSHRRQIVRGREEQRARVVRVSPGDAPTPGRERNERVSFGVSRFETPRRRSRRSSDGDFLRTPRVSLSDRRGRGACEAMTGTAQGHVRSRRRMDSPATSFDRFAQNLHRPRKSRRARIATSQISRLTPRDDRPGHGRVAGTRSMLCPALRSKRGGMPAIGEPQKASSARRACREDWRAPAWCGCGSHEGRPLSWASGSGTGSSAVRRRPVRGRRGPRRFARRSEAQCPMMSA